MPNITISDQGKALKEILLAVEQSDLRAKQLAFDLMREIEKKEALMVCFRRLADEIK